MSEDFHKWVCGLDDPTLQDLDDELEDLILRYRLFGDNYARAIVLQAAFKPKFCNEVLAKAHEYVGQQPRTNRYEGAWIACAIDDGLNGRDLLDPRTPDHVAERLLPVLMQCSTLKSKAEHLPRFDSETLDEDLDAAKRLVASAVREALNRSEFERPRSSSVGVSILRGLGCSKDIAKSAFRSGVIDRTS